MKPKLSEIEAFCLERHRLLPLEKAYLAKEGFYYPLAWSSEKLRPKERLLLTILYVLTERGKKALYPCWRHIAREWEFSESGIRSMVHRLIRLGYLKREEDGKVYIPGLYEKPSYQPFWEEKVSYTKLGVLYFFLQKLRKKIQKKQLIYGDVFTLALYNFFGLKSLASAEWHVFATFKSFEELAYLQREKLRKYRAFRLHIIRDFPFDLKDIPEKPENVSLAEYGLYVEAFFHSNPDRTFKLQALPERRGNLNGLVNSLLKKKLMTRLHQSCYVLEK